MNKKPKKYFFHINLHTKFLNQKGLFLLFLKTVPVLTCTGTLLAQKISFPKGWEILKKSILILI